MASLKFRLKKIDGTRIYFLEEIKQNDLTSEKYKKTGKYLNYAELFLILVSIVKICVSIFACVSLACIAEGIANSAARIKLCAITAL